MAILSVSFVVFERLAAAKLNLMVAELEAFALTPVLKTTNQTVAGVKTFSSAPVLSSGANASNQQITGLCIENRTDDTGCTQTGRIWFRTNV